MARRRGLNGNGNGRRLSTPQSVNAAVKSICDIMRRSNCAGALRYVPELSWDPLPADPRRTSSTRWTGSTRSAT